MKTTLALISSISLALPSCTWYGTDKNGKPTGIMVATKAGKLVHTDQGLYAENFDTQTGFKDAMDFGGTVAGTYFGYKTVTEVASTNAGVTNTETKSNASVAKSKETTKRHSATTKANVETAKIHAATPLTQ